MTEPRAAILHAELAAAINRFAALQRDLDSTEVLLALTTMAGVVIANIPEAAERRRVITEVNKVLEEANALGVTFVFRSSCVISATSKCWASWGARIWRITTLISSACWRHGKLQWVLSRMRDKRMNQLILLEY